MMWPLEDTETKGISDFVKSYEPGMSHGFFVLKVSDDWRQILKYRTFEGSILPIEAAANIYTTFGLLPDKAKESDVAFSKKKRDVLALIHSEADIAQLEADNEEAEKALDALPVARKDNDDIDLAAVITESVKSAIVGLEQGVVKALELQSASILSIADRVKALEEGTVLADKQQPPQTMGSLASWLADQAQGSGSALTTPPPKKKEEGKEEEPPTGPKETPVPAGMNGSANNHALSGIFDKFPGPDKGGV